MDTHTEEVEQEAADNMQQVGATLVLLGKGEVKTERVESQAGGGQRRRLVGSCKNGRLAHRRTKGTLKRLERHRRRVVSSSRCLRRCVAR